MAILSPDDNPPKKFWETLEKKFGTIHYKGPFYPFTGTNYYQKEFGSDLKRSFIAFRGIGSPEKLIELKLWAAELEGEWLNQGNRIFNLDIGYMDVDKVVLASFKRGPCKLYLGDGVYADLLLKYTEGRFDPMPWAFADFKDGRYQKSLLVIRQKMKADLRKNLPSSPEIIL